MRMNKIVYGLLALGLVASCAEDRISPEVTGKPSATGETLLSMQVWSRDANTKSLPMVTDTELNEDVLEDFYYFIWAEDPSQEGNGDTAPLLVGKWEASGETRLEAQSEKIALDPYTDLAATDGESYNGYVWVVANYKNEEATGNWDAAIAHPSAENLGKLSWNALMALPLPGTFDQYTMVDERMDEKQDEGHRFKPQDSFVMTCSQPLPFEVKKGIDQTIQAELQRLATKVSIDINLAKWYIQKNNGNYKYTWYSDPSRIQVYLTYAANAGSLSGEPLTYIGTGEGANSGSFITYRRFAFIPNRDSDNADGTYNFPNGNYEESTPVRWVYDGKLSADEIDAEEYSYKTPDEDKGGDFVKDSEGNILYKTFTRQAYNITGTPFYSYPYDFSGDSGHAPFFKIIVEWTAKKEEEAKRASDEKATAGQDGTPEVIAREFYYKITLPTTDKAFKRNTHYNVKLNLSVLGSEADEAAIDVSGNYSIIDWSDPTEAQQPELNAGRYLSAGSSFEMYTSSIDIPVSSSHDIEVVNAEATYNNYSAATVTVDKLEQSTSSDTGINFKIVATGNNQVTISHVIETDLKELKPRDTSPITYKFRIQQKDNTAYYQDVTVVQYPNLYIIREPSDGNIFVNSYGRAYNSSTLAWDNRGSVTSQNYLDYFLGAVMASNATPSNTNNYDIHTSVLQSDSKYIIMDPREDNGTDGATLYLSGLSNYKKTRSSVTNGIAPTYKVASFYGACVATGNDNISGTLSLEAAIKRCAAYQENGYPAGRWRVPTEAEIEYAISLSLQGLIPALFNASYWASSGRIYSYENKSFSDANDRRCAVRCVYDTWYWGDDKLDNPRAWGGFQTD